GGVEVGSPRRELGALDGADGGGGPLRYVGHAVSLGVARPSRHGRSTSGGPPSPGVGGHRPTPPRCRHRAVAADTRASPPVGTPPDDGGRARTTRPAPARCALTGRCHSRRPSTRRGSPSG